MKKWAIVLLLIAGCQRHNQWQCHHISQKESNSTRILYKSPDPTYGIDIEIVKTHGEMTTYLQVHSGSLCDVDGKAEVTLTTPTKTKSFCSCDILQFCKINLNEFGYVFSNLFTEIRYL